MPENMLNDTDARMFIQGGGPTPRLSSAQELSNFWRTPIQHKICTSACCGNESEKIPIKTLRCYGIKLKIKIKN